MAKVTMSKLLPRLICQLAAEPTLANRDAFELQLVHSMVWVPLQLEADPTVAGPKGERMLLVWADADSARQACTPPRKTNDFGYGWDSVGGSSGLDTLKKARAKRAGLVVTCGKGSSEARVMILGKEVNRVLALGRREDPVLGRLVWEPESDNDAEGIWSFKAGRVRNKTVTGVLAPSRKWNPLTKAELPRIRQTVQWVLANDLPIRQHIADKMWDWWVDYTDPSERRRITAPERFRDKLSMEVIRFDPGKDGMVDFNDHGMLNGYGIQIWVNARGRFTKGPMMG
jgi:hypothetical protein